MLTKLSARNFKRFDFVEIELGNLGVFIGPNSFLPISLVLGATSLLTLAKLRNEAI